MGRFKKISFLAFILLMAALLLAACDPGTTPPSTRVAAAATSTSAPTQVKSNPVNTPPTPTGVPTKTGPGSTAPATGSQAASSTGASAKVLAKLPPIKNASEVELDPVLTRFFLDNMAKNAPDAAMRFFVSNDTTQQLTDNVEAALTSLGYQPDSPNPYKLTGADDIYIGYYYKKGEPDIFIFIGVGGPNKGVLQAFQEIPNLSQAAYQKVAGPVGSTKINLEIIAGTGLITARFNTKPTSAPGAASPVPVQKGPSNLLAISGTKEIPHDAAQDADLERRSPGSVSKSYVSDEEPDKLMARIDSTYRQAGYKFNLPDATAPTTVNDLTFAIYSKSGVADVLTLVMAMPKDSQELEQLVAGVQLSDNEKQKLLTEIKSKKSLYIVLASSGIDLVNYLRALLLFSRKQPTPTPGKP